MKKIELYKCDICGKNYNTAYEAKYCEMNHCNLTEEEYDRWTKSIDSLKTTMENLYYDLAIRSLIDSEEKYREEKE